MHKDLYGRVILDNNELFELIYSGKSIDTCIVSDQELIKRYNAAVGMNFDNIPQLEVSKEYSSIEEYDRFNQSNWFMPIEYINLDIEKYLMEKCPEKNKTRIYQELKEFKSRNMLNLLKWLKFLIDTCRLHNIVRGVGRGSSVASYTLYLLEVHKIDSIKYDLDVREFFKEFDHEANI